MDSLSDFEPLQGQAEKDLVKACQDGHGVAIVPGGRPDKATDDNVVRAGLLRYLLLGGCDKCKPPAKGFHLQGAWVNDPLDLDGETVACPITLYDCHFASEITLRDAKIPALYLSGSYVTKLDAHRVTCGGDIHLRQDFETPNMVNLGGANITGQLDCDGGKFHAKKGNALNANAISVGADVFLRDGFEAWAEVNFIGANITGQLACNGGKFHAKTGKALNADAISVGADVFLRDGFEAWAKVDFVRADITGNLRVQNATLTDSFDGEGMKVGGGFFWNDITGDPDHVCLIDAHIGTLRDGRGAWDGIHAVQLSGFRYDRLDSPIRISERLEWLTKHDASLDFEHRMAPIWSREDHWKNKIEDADQRKLIAAHYQKVSKRASRAEYRFTPQPYVQLANILRKQGDGNGAATIMVARERKQRLAEYLRDIEDYERNPTRTRSALSRISDLKRVWDRVFDWMFGFGHKPQQALWWVIAIWLSSAIFYGEVYRHGQFAPNSDVVLTSADWLRTFPDETIPSGSVLWDTQLEKWTKETNTGRDYETFSRWLYALDLFVPLDALGQETSWAPSHDRGWWGTVGYSLRWFVQMMGWLITAMGAAVVTGLIGRRD